jgi:hypothetical protein
MLLELRCINLKELHQTASDDARANHPEDPRAEWF